MIFQILPGHSPCNVSDIHTSAGGSFRHLAESFPLSDLRATDFVPQHSTGKSGNAFASSSMMCVDFGHRCYTHI